MRNVCNKYRNKKTIIDGYTFDSKKEANRYRELKLMLRADEISDLELQKPYELIPKQKIDGKVVERACNYIADFAYKDKNGNAVVEDVKGMKTKEYIVKRKLMLYVHKIKIKEI